ncbi:hypothetical protein OESDEN_20986 [Oesophagostomum dentatum]|uniref:SXP/RAL-2 family protein Ani s 5-like cation-binding domain-containing protein n=1 Tax=Oesophagostomum dentatum TaxID=61180 RepID=A0A0B1S1Y5_OESDE|nr:hypothetical protein OESDEN_20986 [Oesophagostomum dentatum]
MQAWAEQYNMTEELQQYETRSEQIRADTDNTINTILNQLQGFMSDIQSIRNDQTLSQEEADRRTKSLFDSANRNLATVACCLLNTVSSSQNTMLVSHSYSYGPISVGVYTSAWFRNRRSQISGSAQEDSLAVNKET